MSDRGWHHGRLAAFDIETTGIDYDEDRIVTAALSLVGNGEPIEERGWIVDPGVEIPAEASAIHGITTERARAEGSEPAEVVEEITTQLEAAQDAGIPIVAFNARFDLTFLDREARRHGVRPLIERVSTLLVVDPFVIDKWINRYRKGSRKLAAICAFYGARLDEAHAAESDAIAAARAAWVLAEKGDVVRQVWNPEMGRELAELRHEWSAVRHDLPALHDAQIRWAHEQAVSLADYFAEQGKAKHVEPAWPIVPFEEG